MRRILLLSITWLAAAIATPVAATPGVIEARPGPVATTGAAPQGIRTLSHPGRHPGLIYVPTGYSADRPAPLLVMLHGAGGSPRPMIDAAKRQAEASGVILFAPAAAAATWDLVAGRSFGGDAIALDAQLRELFGHYAVDGRRVGIAGFSDGGSYALSLGLGNGELFSRVAAFAPGFALPARQSGRPAIFVTHGTADNVLPIDATSRRIVAALQGAGYALDYVEHAGGHVMPPPALATVIAALTRPRGAAAAAPGPLPLAPPAADDVENPPLERLLWKAAPPPIGRFLDPVCVRVSGGSSTIAQQIEAQVRSVAHAAGVPAHWGLCRPNLRIMLARDPARPASWRYTLGRRTPRGLASAVVTLDKDAAERLPVETVGGFAALVGFAELELAAAPPPETLLALFSHPQAAQRLTTRDVDFLRRLYAAH